MGEANFYYFTCLNHGIQLRRRRLCPPRKKDAVVLTPSSAIVRTRDEYTSVRGRGPGTSGTRESATNEFAPRYFRFEGGGGQEEEKKSSAAFFLTFDTLCCLELFMSIGRKE